MSSTATHVMVVLDGELRCLSVSEDFAALYGRSADELLGLPLSDLDAELAAELAPSLAAAATTPTGAGSSQAPPEAGGRLVVVSAPSRSDSIAEPSADISPATDEAGFDQLLGDISSAFLGAQFGDVAYVADPSLAAIADFFSLDRISIYHLQGKRLTLAHCWYRDGSVPEDLRQLTVADVPWMWAEAGSGRNVVLRSLDDFPREAASDREAVSATWLGSHLIVPMIVGGNTIGAISFGSSTPGLPWSEDTQQRLRLISNAIANGEMARQLRFERALSDVATAFQSASGEELGHAIFHALGRLSDVLQCDIATLIEIDDAGNATEFRWAFSHDSPDNLEGAPFDLSEYHWFNEMSRKGNIVILRGGEDALPEDAVNERRWARRWGVEAYLAIPLKVDGRLTGVLQFGARDPEITWPEPLLERGRVVGKLMVAAVDRLRGGQRSRELRRQLYHADRVATAGQLMATIAHELSQPLTAILSNARAGARFIDQGGYSEEDIHGIMADVAADARRAGDTVRRLRSLLGGGERLTEPVNVGEAIEEAVSLIDNEARFRGATVTVQIEDNLPLTTADRVQLQQVALNLMVNGLEAMQDVEESQRQLTVSCSKDDGEIVVAIEDNGPGLADDLADSVFDPFYTTKESGMGLGLSVSRMIATAHGGSLQLAPPQAGATRFELRLPAEGEKP